MTGVDLAAVADAGGPDIEQIKDLLCEHMVLFFPDQTISVDEHVAWVVCQAPDD